jgi:hypothetical protein
VKVAVEPKVAGGTKRTSETDILGRVVDRLAEARSAAESTSEKTLLYFIDMALLEAREALAAAPGAKGCNDPSRPPSPR